MFLAPLGTLPFTDEDARGAGVIRRELERAGTPIGVYATLIAGQALQRGLILVTANGAGFQRVGGLRSGELGAVILRFPEPPPDPICWVPARSQPNVAGQAPIAAFTPGG